MAHIRRLAETIGADPTLTQNIRIDVNVRNEPTVTVTRLADADQIGRIIQCSTFSDYTLVENGELKRLRKGATLTDEERDVLGRVADDAGYRAMEGTERVVRRLLDRLG
jgi:hypothetical protein